MVVVPLMALTYLLLAPVALFFTDYRGTLPLPNPSDEIEYTLFLFFEPAWWCAKHCGSLSKVFDWELLVLQKLLGPCCGA